MFGYRLVKESEEPREIIRAFADELEGHLQRMGGGYYEESRRPGLDTLAREASGNVKRLLQDAGDYLVLPDVIDPEGIRFRAMTIAATMLFISDFYGELGTQSMERVR